MAQEHLQGGNVDSEINMIGADHNELTSMRIFVSF